MALKHVRSHRFTVEEFDRRCEMEVSVSSLEYDRDEKASLYGGRIPRSLLRPRRRNSRWQLRADPTRSPRSGLATS